MAGRDMTVTNEMGGTVVGSNVQAGAIHGGVHVHLSGVGETPVPRQLPLPPARFTGRAEELRLLDAVLGDTDTTRPAMVVLTGPGGVGKSALALHWANGAADRFPDGRLFVDLGGFSADGPTDPGEALGQFLRALGVPAEKVPVRLSEQAALYRSVTAGKALLVVLDNALSAAQARVLVPASPRSRVLVSSRSRLTGLVGDGAHLVEVGPLPKESAIKLLVSTVGEARVREEWERAEDLVALCGGLPIAVRVAAARLLVRSRWSVRRVWAELVDEQSRLSGLADGDQSVRASFDLSYRMLEPRAAVLYRRLGVHPGGEFSAAVASSALGGGDKDCDALLEALLDASLVEERSEDRYRFHDLLRLHARHRLEVDDTPEDRLAAIRRILEWYLATALRADEVVTPYRRRLPYRFSVPPSHVKSFVDRDGALAWLEHERVNLIAGGRLALDEGLPELAWRLADVLWPLFLTHKHYRDRLEVDERGVEAARRWGNAFGEADMLKRWGLALRTMRRFDEAEERLRESMGLWDRMGDVRGLCDAREGLALVYQATGRLDAARAEFEQLLIDNEELAAWRSVGLTAINLGTVLLESGDAKGALPHLRRAEETFRTLVAGDPYNHARAVTALAAACCAVGDTAGAESHAEAALHAMRELGSANGTAEAHVVLADVARATGRLDRSRDHLERAEEVFRHLGSPKADLVRRRLGELGG